MGRGRIALVALFFAALGAAPVAAQTAHRVEVVEMAQAEQPMEAKRPIKPTAAVVVPPGNVIAVVPDSGSQTVPWGQWLSDLILQARNLLVALASLAVGSVVAASPMLVRPLIAEFLSQRVIERAVDGAIARAGAALRNQSTTLPEAQGILYDAETYIISAAPKVAERLGAFLIPRIQAQMAKAGVAPAAALKPDLSTHIAQVELDK